MVFFFFLNRVDLEKSHCKTLVTLFSLAGKVNQHRYAKNALRWKREDGLKQLTRFATECIAQFPQNLSCSWRQVASTMPPAQHGYARNANLVGEGERERERQREREGEREGEWERYRRKSVFESRLSRQVGATVRGNIGRRGLFEIRLLRTLIRSLASI